MCYLMTIHLIIETIDGCATSCSGNTRIGIQSKKKELKPNALNKPPLKTTKTGGKRKRDKKSEQI